MNKIDSISIRIKAKIEYVNEINDFAILSILNDKYNLDHLKEIYFKVIPPHQWMVTKDFQEGEFVLYIGYPMKKGIGINNYPLSRTGIISQLVNGQSSFLIDGFVQHGHGGSPVFLIRCSSNDSTESCYLYLIGITSSFPEEYSDVYRKTGYEKDPLNKVLVNPGFSNVTSMDKIIPILVNKFGFKFR